MSRENEGPAVLTLSVDGISYQAMEEPDLSWLRAYGQVFWVQDQLFSGNLCFGVEGPYGRLFIKYAGAKTVNYRGKPTDAVKILHNAMPLYNRSHPALVNTSRYLNGGTRRPFVAFHTILPFCRLCAACRCILR